MTKFVPIEDIQITRTTGSPEPDPVAVADLATSINDHGLKVPVLLDEDMNLVDGLLRIRAHQLLGRSTVESLIATTLEDALSNIAKAHKVHPPYRRISEIYTALRPLIHRRHATIKAANNRAFHKGRPTAKVVISQELLKKALKVTSRGIIDASYQLYRYVHRDDDVGEVARARATRLEHGELGPYGAVNGLKRYMQEQEKLGSPGIQRQVITTALMKLAGVAKGVEDVGRLDDSITVEEAVEWKKQYTSAHGDLFRLSMRLSERIRRG